MRQGKAAQQELTIMEAGDKTEVQSAQPKDQDGKPKAVVPSGSVILRRAIARGGMVCTRRWCCHARPSWRGVVRAAAAVPCSSVLFVAASRRTRVDREANAERAAAERALLE